MGASEGEPVPQADWDRLLETERLIQRFFPECMLVGGTAAAPHAHHRISLDVDSVMRNLREQYPQVLARLEALSGWRTRRLRPPVLPLGNFEGVDVGIRQLRRGAPLETEQIAGITVPTLAEMLRIKGWLVVTRNALRDFLDFCALADKLGPRFEAALSPMDLLYPQPVEGCTTLQQLAKQLAEPKPYDFDPAHDSLEAWRALQPPWTDWGYVTDYCRKLAQRVFDLLLAPPPAPPPEPEASETR
ncbi:MAG: hypothetical protein K6U87_10220 [Firmicutes bacterium]|nr:hypothetical protein [Bacillota bacterium]